MSTTQSPTRRRRPGRPANTVHGVFSVRVDAERGLGWSDGQWGGDADLVAAAEKLVADGAVLEVPGAFGQVIKASAMDPVAALAVMAKVTGATTRFRGDIPLAAIITLATAAPSDGQVA